MYKKIIIIAILALLVSGCSTVESSAAQATQKTYNKAVEMGTGAVVDDINNST